MKRLVAIAWAAFVLALAGPAAAQTYPSQPIRLVVPFAPGGGADILARIIGDPLSKRLGQPIVIENKPGAGATLGADTVAKAAPDGYTLLLATPGPQITNPYLMPKLPYDPNKDFTPVAMLVLAVNVLVVTPSLPVKSVAELIAYAKAHPGKLNFSSSGVGASSHLSGELLKMMAGIDIVHVPYRGSGPSIQDILAGNIQMSIDTVSTMLPHIQSGGMRALAVATLDKNPTLPDLPTIAETLPGFDGSGINYICAPAGLPQPIADRLNKEINAVLTDPDVVKRMTIAGLTPVVESQADLAARIQREQVKWKKVIDQIAK
jgi:tripartite-type tricarboxylate transporter receptor subunit TctC